LFNQKKNISIESGLTLINIWKYSSDKSKRKNFNYLQKLGSIQGQYDRKGSNRVGSLPMMKTEGSIDEKTLMYVCTDIIWWE